MPRTATVDRKTAETDIRVELNLDGSGNSQISTGVGFFDHMLTLLAKHAAIDLNVKRRAICTSINITRWKTSAFASARPSNRRWATKRAFAATATSRCRWKRHWSPAAIDFSGRYCLVFNAPISSPKIGDFDSELVEDFWQAIAANALCNLHVLLHHGRNSHHISEAIFKATARALRMAIEPDPRMTGVPSTRARCS